MTLGASGVNKIWSKYIPVQMMTAGTSANPAVAVLETGEAKLDVFDFDKDAVEACGFSMALGADYDGSALTIEYYWTAASGSGDVRWEIEGVCLDNSEVLGVATGQQWSATDTLITANDLHITSATASPTRAGAGTWFYGRIRRDAVDGADTLTTDARLIGIRISYTG